MKSSDLFTRETANAGRRVEIPGRDGKPTGEWMTIHHVDSDAFRRKRAEVLASAAILPASASQEERKRLRDTAQRELLASLVSGWSLEDAFSPEAMAQLLENAPYLADWLERITSDDQLFFGSGSTVSSSIAEPRPDLNNPQKAEPDASATT